MNKNEPIALKDLYFDMVMSFERLHRLFLEMLKIELESMEIRDLSNTQAMILYNIGKGQLTVGEISNRGYYMGSNVSYNLKKMVENHYVSQQQSLHDRRSTRVRLSQKGIDVHNGIDRWLESQTAHLQKQSFGERKFELLLEANRFLESYWTTTILQPPRHTQFHKS